MATTPAGSQPQTIQPVFKRIQQAVDHDCAFACIAMITNKSLDEVVQVAIDKFKHPANGPYFITEELINKVLAHYGFVSTIYKEVETGLVDIHNVAIAMVDYDPETEIGRHVVFVRDKSNTKQPVEYMIDPAYWIDASLYVRTDFQTLVPAWFIGVTPMNRMAAKS
ncbi:hypothetical protein [Undibacterium sp.]|uniref:hypothetical protein n=1 Tax=Undibacterium sp. TaxID=1914977 RepID=UPI00273095F4|nr:hypothetical protein [Undibacterium sp.]MDP1977631.1 hypothetical protein [Undibacterium sp.]